MRCSCRWPMRASIWWCRLLAFAIWQTTMPDYGRSCACCVPGERLAFSTSVSPRDCWGRFIACTFAVCCRRSAASYRVSAGRILTSPLLWNAFLNRKRCCNGCAWRDSAMPSGSLTHSTSRECFKRRSSQSLQLVQNNQWVAVAAAVCGLCVDVLPVFAVSALGAGDGCFAVPAGVVELLPGAGAAPAAATGPPKYFSLKLLFTFSVMALRASFNFSGCSLRLISSLTSVNGSVRLDSTL